MAVSELFASELGSKDLQQGLANVFVKSGEAHEHPIVLHEYLAARMAHSLGVPVPFGELAAVAGGAQAWATAIVGHDGEVSAPPDPLEASLAEPHIYAGIAVFDVWLLNIDRSDANLLWTPDGGLWAIDHEQCFDAHDSRVMRKLSDSSGNVHSSAAYRLAPPDKDRMVSWSNLIFQHGRSWARSACEAAFQRQLASRKTLAEYERFLRDRAINIKYLLQQTYGTGQSDLLHAALMTEAADK